MKISIKTIICRKFTRIDVYFFFKFHSVLFMSWTDFCRHLIHFFVKNVTRTDDLSTKNLWFDKISLEPIKYWNLTQINGLPKFNLNHWMMKPDAKSMVCQNRQFFEITLEPMIHQNLMYNWWFMKFHSKSMLDFIRTYILFKINYMLKFYSNRRFVQQFVPMIFRNDSKSILWRNSF